MKILFFMESYFCSGVDTFMINLIDNWPNESDELVLLSNRHEGLSLIKDSLRRPCRISEHQEEVFTSYFIKGKNRKLIDATRLFALRLFSFLLRYVYLIGNIMALNRILLRNKPDRLVVVSGGYPGGDSTRAACLAWGLRGNKPPCTYIFFGQVSDPRWHIRLQENVIDYLLARLTGRFITDSEATARTMSRRKYIYKSGKVSFIHNGIEVVSDRGEDRPTIKEELGIPFNSKLCLMLGAYTFHPTYDKGHYFLLQAFKRVVDKIPSAYLLICGSGTNDEIERVRRLVANLKLARNVHLSGFRNDVPFLLRQTDLLLVSSQAFESFGFTSIEAMARGIPVIATKVGGIPEVVVNDQGGYCLDKNDIEGYANRIIDLLENEKMRQEQGLKARQRYQDNFTAKRMAQQYYQILNE